MNGDDLRNQLLEIASTTLNDAERAGRYRRIAWEAVERLEASSVTSPEVCVDSVKWLQPPLGGIEIDGEGGIDFHECEIVGGDGDIREFFARTNGAHG
jgi:hypothetical protein